MPRIIFDSIGDLNKWLRIHYIRGYEAYISSENREIIFIPTKSTRPLLYAYYKFKEGELEKLMKRLEELNITYFYVKRVEWTEDKPIGAKFISEEEL